MMAKSDLEKHHDEVRELQLENARDRAVYMPAEHQSTITVTNASGDEKELEIDAFDQRLHIQSHGVAVLDHEGAIALRKRLDRAIQAIS